MKMFQFKFKFGLLPLLLPLYLFIATMLIYFYFLFFFFCHFILLYFFSEFQDSLFLQHPSAPWDKGPPYPRPGSPPPSNLLLMKTLLIPRTDLLLECMFVWCLYHLRGRNTGSTQHSYIGLCISIMWIYALMYIATYMYIMYICGVYNVYTYGICINIYVHKFKVVQDLKILS